MRTERLKSTLLLLGIACFAACKPEIEPKPADLSYAAIPTATLDSQKLDYAAPITERQARPARLVEVASRMDVQFVHDNGATGQKWLPETMGSGVCFLDANNDGLQDLFFVNSKSLAQENPKNSKSSLYINQGQGKLNEATESWKLTDSVYGQGCAAADYDGDGDTDLYVTALGDNLLYRNDGVFFTEVAKQANVSGQTWTDPQGQKHPEWSTSAAFTDLDGDGWLDLFVANYVRWSPATDVYSTLAGHQKGYALPSLYQGETCRLYRNLGDGTFEDITQKSGIMNPNSKAMGVAIEDLNEDGQPDIVVANDTEPNFLLINQGNAVFKDEALSYGIAYDESGRARAGMGIDIALIGPDRQPSIAIGNFSQEPVSLYQKASQGLFIDGAAKARLSRATLPMLTFGLLFKDINVDGQPDLILANGHLEPDIQLVSKELTYRQKPQLFWGKADGQFIEAGEEIGADFHKPIVGRGLAAGDLDGDGDPDLVLTENAGPARIFLVEGPDPKKLVQVHLEGNSPNTQAIGAKIRIAHQSQSETSIKTGSSYLSQSAISVTLSAASGQADSVDLEVRWPGAKEWSLYPHAPLGHSVRISQTKGINNIKPLAGI